MEVITILVIFGIYIDISKCIPVSTNDNKLDNTSVTFVKSPDKIYKSNYTKIENEKESHLNSFQNHTNEAQAGSPNNLKQGGPFSGIQTFFSNLNPNQKMNTSNDENTNNNPNNGFNPITGIQQFFSGNNSNPLVSASNNGLISQPTLLLGSYQTLLMPVNPQNIFQNIGNLSNIGQTLQQGGANLGNIGQNIIQGAQGIGNLLQGNPNQG